MNVEGSEERESRSGSERCESGSEETGGSYLMETASESDGPPDA